MGVLEQMRQQLLVLEMMLRQLGEAILFHELLFVEEMEAGKLDEPAQQAADLFTAGVANAGQAKIVHRVHKNAVLIIHGADADGAGMIPGEKDHWGLQEPRKNIGCAAQVMTLEQR